MRHLAALFLPMLFLLASAVLLPRPLLAEEELPLEAIGTAPVEVDGEVLFILRGTSSFPAERRAERVSRRIIEAAKSPSYDPAELQLRSLENGYELRSGSFLIFTILDADARLEGLETDVLGLAIKQRVSEAIESYRQDRSPEGIRQAIKLALIASVIFVLLVLALVFLERVTNRLIDRFLRRRMAQLEEKAGKIVKLQQFWDTLKLVLRLVYAGLGLVALYYYVSTVLLALPWTRGIAVDALSLFSQPLLEVGRGIIDSIPDLIALFIIFLLARFALKLIKRFFLSIQIGRIVLPNFEREWAQPTERLIRLVLIVFALVMAYPYIPGAESAAFKGISIFAGVMLSLGSSSVIANLVAGYSMIYRRAFQVGDRVQIAGVVGDVVEMRLQATHLVTPKNERVTLPNSTVLNAQVINYSALAKEKGLILHTEVGIGYEVPWRSVEEMLLEAADRTSGLLKKPKPFVLQTRLGDFSPIYEINAYTEFDKSVPATYSALHANIQDVFAEKGVQIMTPNYVADPEVEKIPPQET
jgi:small-conductance mechanosensitive channel